ncbi:LrgB family protein [Massilia sp. RP-1-19]|uniref:LrgB family protein n=1 Tax=Massilia polaris TaxID=2728846 RepID=A0A848HNP2_9BURK|nr:LrgB family protein [Massilia polaris]NML60148.1 LrgB family protein [Massilia polaris]
MTDLPEIGTFWVYLTATPLLGLTLTLCAYTGAQAIHVRCRMSPLANPVAIALVALVLALSGMSYKEYFAGAQLVHFLLGPATVALAIPLARQVPTIRRVFLPLFAGLFAGSVCAILSAVLLVMALGGSELMAVSAAPKSATTPIAMAVAERLGGMSALTAALVVGTGVLGAVVARALFNWMGIGSPKVRGFALGVASHGIGTARAFQVSPEMGAFAGLGMGLNAILTALLGPMARAARTAPVLTALSR